MAAPSVICVMGPTASGKTDLAIALADALPRPVDLISVDSALVYKGMNIGTAKPDADTLSEYPHALIDIREPHEPYSAADFANDARQCIQQSLDADRIPVLVGGTMLYYRALLNGLSQLPAADPNIRARLEAEANEQGWAALHARLSALDAETGQRLHPNDTQRIQRALEIHELTGLPPSEAYRQDEGAGLPWPVKKIALLPNDRAVLHARIEQRFKHMQDMGFLDEMRQLFADERLTADSPSMRAVGYRQMWRYLEGEWSLEEAIQRGIFATRQLAKRQITWLRSEPDMQVVPVESVQLADVLSFLGDL